MFLKFWTNCRLRSLRFSQGILLIGLHYNNVWWILDLRCDDLMTIVLISMMQYFVWVCVWREKEREKRRGRERMVKLICRTSQKKCCKFVRLFECFFNFCKFFEHWHLDFHWTVFFLKLTFFVMFFVEPCCNTLGFKKKKQWAKL